MSNTPLGDEVDKLRKQNKILRTALQFYADPLSWEDKREDWDARAINDTGDKARVALSQAEKIT